VSRGKRLSFDLDGLETDAELIAAAKPAQQVPIVVTTEPVSEAAEEFELPGWFAAVLAVVNLLLGLTVFFLVVPPALPEDFLARVAELQRSVSSATPDEEVLEAA
jgi:hypothetical protein